jgi:branched-subunit amino acid aminotransferase/4-amino-4-deoxychorismate lyase
MICVEVAAFGSFFSGKVKLQGLKDVFRPITGADKVSGNYTDTFARKKAVKARGYSDYLSFDFTGNIEEVSTCAIGFIKLVGTGQVEYHFPPVREDAPDSSQAHTYHSLDSITRRSIIEMLRCLNHTVIVRDIHADELSSFAGMFTMGNAAGVTPVAQVDLCESGDADVSERIIFETKAADALIADLQTLLRQARRGQHTEPALVGFNEAWVDRINVAS